MRPLAILLLAAALTGAAAPERAAAIQFHKVTADTTRETDPAPSPDGKWIVFSSDRKQWYQIYVMPAEGGEWRQLSFEPDSTRSSTPSWSPDGSSILFVSTRGKRYNVYSVPFAGGEPRKMTNSDGGSRFAAYSPDGKKIAFYSNRERPTELYGYNLYVMDAEGETTPNSARKITNSMGSPGHPVWSPDGTTLAYVAKTYEADKQNTMEGNILFAKYHVWTMPSGGGAERQRTGGTINGEPVEETWPAWSPDGKWIAFSRMVGTTKRDIWVLEVSTGNAYPLTNAGDCGKPTWSADGKSLYYSCTKDRNEDIWVATDITLPPPGVKPIPAMGAVKTAAAKKSTAAAKPKTPAKRAPAKTGTSKTGVTK